MPASAATDAAYELAAERYAAAGVDTEAALRALATIPISLHCWQGDDVQGFESAGGALGGGLAVTGNYPGRARTPDELRGRSRAGARPDPRPPPRSTSTPATASSAASRSTATQIEPATSPAGSTGPGSSGLGLDFNPTCFAHPKAADGFTLAHRRRRHPRLLDRALPPLPGRSGRPSARPWARPA